MGYYCKIPIKYKFKTKKTKQGYSNKLVSLNFIFGLHYTQRNKIKQHFSKLIKEQLIDLVPDKPMKKYRINYYLWLDRKNADPLNICSFIDKVYQDAIQEIGLIENDNLEHCMRVTVYNEGLDKENPHVEIRLEEVY